ncbi:MAG: hypothetical protein AAF797_13765 [Planctomycetota bacterium]
MSESGDASDAVKRVPVMGVGAADVPAVLAELEGQGVDAAVFWDNDLTWGEAPTPQLWVAAGEEELARVIIEGYYKMRQEERRQAAGDGRPAGTPIVAKEGQLRFLGLMLLGMVLGIGLAWWLLS